MFNIDLLYSKSPIKGLNYVPGIMCFHFDHEQAQTLIFGRLVLFFFLTTSLFFVLGDRPCPRVLLSRYLRHRRKKREEEKRN